MGGLLSSNEPPPQPTAQNYFYEPSARRVSSYTDSYVSQPRASTSNSSNASYYGGGSFEARRASAREREVAQRLRSLLSETYSQPRASTSNSGNVSYYGGGSFEARRASVRENDLAQRLSSLRVSETYRTVPNSKRSTRNPQLFDIFNPGYDIVTYTPLEPYDPDYQRVSSMITNKKNFKVDSILKIENPYLEKAYQLKKCQKEAEFGYVNEKLLFHGTKRVNVDAICKFNFNWRLCKAHKYGNGVSFSTNSTYASVYSDENVYNKIMIVAKVLVVNSCIGNKFMQVPPNGFDTAVKDDGIVTVKFEDNEFCPVFKINYHVMDESVGKGHRNKNRGRRSRSGGSLSPSYTFNGYGIYGYDDFDY